MWPSLPFTKLARRQSRQSVALVLGLMLGWTAPAVAQEPPPAAMESATEISAPKQSEQAVPTPQDLEPAPGPAASVPTAAEPSPARTLREFSELGVRLYQAGDYDGAIRAFSSAYTLRARPVLLFNIAQAHRRAGREADALPFYELFVRQDPQSPYKSEAEAYIGHIRGRLSTVGPPAVSTQALLAELEKNKPKPLYRKPWFWGVLGGALAATGAVVTVGIILGTRDPQTTLGTVTPQFP